MNTATPRPDFVAWLMNCSVGQVKAQFGRNARQLSAMADEAAKTGRKINSYSEAELRAMAANSRKAAQ